MDVCQIFKRKSLTTLLLGLGLIAPAQAEIRYDVINLGPLYGRTGQGIAINELGHVTGYMEPSSVAYGYGHAFLYSAGLSRDLGTLGGHGSWGSGINDLDQVVGYSYLPAAAGNALEHYHAFLYSGGTMTDLGTLGGNNSTALDINNHGAITGWAQTATNASHAFISSGGAMTDLGIVGSGRAINDNGQVAGTTSVSGNSLAFITSGGGAVLLGTLGGQMSTGEAINNRGDVTGASTLASGATHAYLHDGGAMIDLGALDGGTNYSLGRGINDYRDVVGTSAVPGAYHAFLRSFSDGVMRDLNDLIDPASGWALNYALDINNAGMITGQGTFNGYASAFLLTPDYQIKPNPNPQGGIIQVDNAPHGYYNAVTFKNGGYIGIDPGGQLSNRTGASIINNGVIQNNGNFSVGGLLISYGALLNNGSMTVLGELVDKGATVNTGTLITKIGSTYYNNSDGVIIGLTGHPNVFSNQGLIVNQGTFEIAGFGSQLQSPFGAVTFFNEGTLKVRDGAAFHGELQSSGTVLISNGGLMVGHLTTTGGLVNIDGASSQGFIVLDNSGNVSVSGGATLHLSKSSGGTGSVKETLI